VVCDIVSELCGADELFRVWAKIGASNGFQPVQISALADLGDVP
jgi:hypothetical protein